MGGEANVVPLIEATDWRDRIDRLTGHGRPLLLQVLGICIARNPKMIMGLTGPQGLNELLDTMLDDERTRRWPDLFPESLWNTTRTEVNHQAFRQIEQAVGCVTLMRGLMLPEQAKFLTQLCGQLALLQRNVLSRILRGEFHTVGTEETAFKLPPLEPDLLGERLLLNLVTASADPSGLSAPTAAVQASDWVATALQCNFAGLMETLRLIASDFPLEQATRVWVSAILDIPIEHSVFFTGEIPEIFHGTLPGIFLQFVRSGAPLPPEMFNAFLRNFQQNTNSWRSAYIELISALPELLSNHKNIELFEAACQRLWSQFDPPSDENENLLLACLGAVDFSFAYGKAERWEELERHLDRLNTLAQAFPLNPELQLILANGAVNASGAYGEAMRWDDLQRQLDRLSTLAQAFPRNLEIPLEFAKAAFNASSDYGKAARWEDLQRQLDCLETLAQTFSLNPDFQLRLANGAYGASRAYGNANRWEDLQRQLDCLNNLIQASSTNPDIQLRLAEAALNASNAYGTAERWEDLESQIEHLNALVQAFPLNPDIPLTLAKAAVNASSDYGKAERWEDLEGQSDCLKRTLTRIECEGTVFSQMSRIALNQWQRSNHSSAAKLMAIVVSHWPGFELELERGNYSVALVAQRLLAGSRAEAEHSQAVRLSNTVQEWRTRASKMMLAIDHGESPDQREIAWLWQQRRFSPDRGAALIARLQAVGIDTTESTREGNPTG